MTASQPIQLRVKRAHFGYGFGRYERNNLPSKFALGASVAEPGPAPIIQGLNSIRVLLWFVEMRKWFRDIWVALYTVAHGLFVTLRYWLLTYKRDRGAFTQRFEYPEKPVPVAARYRGFHRFDLTTCIACDQCAKACPVDCIYIGKSRVEGGKGFRVTGFAIDYSKCMFCALCVEPCPVDCIFMGATHDLSCYSRDGCIVDFSRLPLDVSWGRSTLNPTAVADSKVITQPVHGGPNQ